MADQTQERPPRRRPRNRKRGGALGNSNQPAQDPPAEKQSATHASRPSHTRAPMSAQSSTESTRRAQPKPANDSKRPKLHQNQAAPSAKTNGPPAATSSQRLPLRSVKPTTAGLARPATTGRAQVDAASVTSTSHKMQPAHRAPGSPTMTPGQICEQNIVLVPWKLVTNYPTIYVHEEDRDHVRAYFTTNLHSDREWDLFFIPQPGSSGKDSILFVPLPQVESFLRAAAAELGPFRTLSPLRKDRLWDSTEVSPQWPRPRFLTRLKNAQGLKPALQRIQQYPPNNYDDYTMETYKAFKVKMEILLHAGKGSSGKDNFVDMWNTRLEKQKAYGRVTKRVQRYLGLRGSNNHFEKQDNPLSGWRPDMNAPFQPKDNVRFVCIDVEAYELNTNLVTEIGFAVLDTEDIIGVAPGENGEAWIAAMQGYHFRIAEYSHMINKRFVKGCPDKFNFGQSSFAGLRDMQKIIGSIIGDPNSPDTRPVILVGHDIIGDLKYLRLVNYNVWSMPHVLDEVDTQVMFRRVQRNSNGRSLVTACAAVDIETRDLHNAGNDAHYTLAVMIAMAVKQRAMAMQDLRPWQMVEEAEWSDGDIDDGGIGLRSSEPVEKPKDPAKDIPFRSHQKPQGNYSRW